MSAHSRRGELPYLGVGLLVAAWAEQAVALGDEVSVEPYDMPHIGRTAVLGGPRVEARRGL